MYGGGSATNNYFARFALLIDNPCENIPPDTPDQATITEHGQKTTQPLSGCWIGSMTNKHLERGNHRVMSTEAPLRLSTLERRSIPVLRSYIRFPDGIITSVTIMCSFPFRWSVPLRRSVPLRCSISPVPLSIGPPFGLTG